MDKFTFKNAVLTKPFVLNGKKYAGGFDKNLKPIESLRLNNDCCINTYQVPYFKPRQRIEEKTIFGGYLLRHYGHFILEGLSRYYYYKQKNEKIVFFSNTNTFTDWHKEIINYLDIRERIVFIKQPTFFRELVIPDPGYILMHKFSNDQVLALGGFDNRNIKYLNKQIWLSRAALSNKTINREAELQNILLKENWIIVNPEKMSFIEQLEMLNSCKRIAGFSGTAFHTVIFLKSVHAQIDIFQKEKKLSRDFNLIKVSKKLNQNIHIIPMVKNKNDENHISWQLTDENISDIVNRLNQ